MQFHNVSIGKQCTFTFSGTVEEVKEFFAIVEEKIVSEGEVDEETLFVKTSPMKFYYDGKSLWFFFVKRPYFYLKDRIREKNYECWLRVTGRK